jgi:glycosyltransferase involved in cell wall biosynthesis
VNVYHAAVAGAHGKLSVVVPVYRSEATIEPLVERLHASLGKLERPFELVLVDDGSPDASWAELSRLKDRFPGSMRIVRLAVNGGQHNALLCGLALCNGEVVITMDDDLQNPPEEIPALVAAIDQGFDLAIGAYAAKQHTAARNLAGGLIDWVQRRIFRLPRDFQLTSFRAVRRHVVDAAVQMGSSYPYITSMLLANTATYVNVPVRHERRGAGRSGYTLRRSLSLAANLLLGYSSFPAYLVATLCALAFFFAVAWGGWVIYGMLAHGVTVPGWASLAVLISLFNATILLCLAIQSVYLSRLSRVRSPYRIRELRD